MDRYTALRQRHRPVSRLVQLKAIFDPGPDSGIQRIGDVFAAMKIEAAMRIWRCQTGLVLYCEFGTTVALYRRSVETVPVGDG